jgi:membrane-bound lytic murein transglycosylase D
MARRYWAIVGACALCLSASAWSADSAASGGPGAAAAPAAGTASPPAQPAPSPAPTAATPPVDAAAAPTAAAVKPAVDPDASLAPAADPASPPAAPADAAAARMSSADPAANDPAGMQQASEPASPQATRNLWERIRKGFAMPDLATKRVTSSTHWYAGQPDYIARMAARASLYLYYIVQETEKRGLPSELALLPFVESAMQPQAVSRAQAAGLWQFIPSTGRLYSLEQNLWKDERFGVVESTRAALDYLEKLHAQFGSWPLALAAYNYGEAGVQKALAYNRSRHKPLTYESLRLPRETQYYLPKLQAIKNIVADPQRYGIELPEIRDEPYFVTVSGSRDIDVATAAQLADMPIDDFRALNPAFNRPLIVGATAPMILLPADRGDKFGANLAAWEATGQPLASWTAYRLKTGETLAALAQRVGVTEASLRAANHVPPRYVLRAGSTILIPRDETMGEDVSSEMLDGSMALVPEKAGLRKITVRVRRGDSLSSIARRWHVSADEIVAWNDLRSTDLFAGQRLSLTVAGSTGATHKKSSPHIVHASDEATQTAAGAQSATR